MKKSQPQSDGDLALSDSLRKLVLCNVVLASLLFAYGVGSLTWFLIHAGEISAPLIPVLALLSCAAVIAGSFGVFAAVCCKKWLLAAYPFALVPVFALSVAHVADGFLFVRSMLLTLGGAAGLALTVLSTLFTAQLLVSVSRIGNYSFVTALPLHGATLIPADAVLDSACEETA